MLPCNVLNCFMYFWPLYEGATQYGCCQNRRKIRGDRNARPAQKAFHRQADRWGGGLGGISKILLPLRRRFLPLCICVFVHLGIGVCVYWSI